MILNGHLGAMAFCGGVDLNEDRLDDTGHAAMYPFHDVHAKVEGPAVGDLNQTFIQRWDNHPTRPPRLPSPGAPFAPSPGSQYVQVSRTFPRLRYPFLPGVADLGTLNAVRRAIQRAQRFIYLEDQYATPYPGPYPYSAAADTVGILTDLLSALARIEYLVIVVPNHTDLPQGRYRRRNFIRSLRDAYPAKVFPFFLYREGTGSGGHLTSTTAAADLNLAPDGGGTTQASGSRTYPHEIYVHSKVWIIDDVYAKIGSANCNRRSLTHDTEIDIHIIDGAVISGARAFAQNLRLDLWGEHLNLSGAAGKYRLTDPTLALHYWQHLPTGARIRPYDENNDAGTSIPPFLWDVIDPDGR